MTEVSITYSNGNEEEDTFYENYLRVLKLCGVILTKENFESAINFIQSEHSDSIGAPKVFNDILHFK